MSPKEEDKEYWMRATIFHSQVKCGVKVCRIIISGSMVKRIVLKTNERRRRTKEVERGTKKPF